MKIINLDAEFTSGNLIISIFPWISYLFLSVTWNVYFFATANEQHFSLK